MVVGGRARVRAGQGWWGSFRGRSGGCPVGSAGCVGGLVVGGGSGRVRGDVSVAMFPVLGLHVAHLFFVGLSFFIGSRGWVSWWWVGVWGRVAAGQGRWGSFNFRK